MGFLDRLLGRGKKMKDDAGGVMEDIGEKIEDITDGDDKTEEPRPTGPPPPGPGAQSGSGGGGQPS